MNRSLLAVCGGMLLAAGCIGGPGSVHPEPLARRSQPPSPEAADVLRKLGHVDKAGNVLTGEHYDAARLECLEAELKKVGAKMGSDGKLHDHNGREVYIWEASQGYGCQVSEETLRREAEELQQRLRKLRERYTVIELPYFGLPAC